MQRSRTEEGVEVWIRGGGYRECTNMIITLIKKNKTLQILFYQNSSQNFSILGASFLHRSLTSQLVKWAKYYHPLKPTLVSEIVQIMTSFFSVLLQRQLHSLLKILWVISSSFLDGLLSELHSQILYFLHNIEIKLQSGINNLNMREQRRRNTWHGQASCDTADWHNI